MENLRKRSIVIDGIKTSVSLEDEFWTELKTIARLSELTLAELVCGIKSARSSHKNLSSAVRVYVLRHCLDRMKSALPMATGPNPHGMDDAACVVKVHA